MTRRDVDLLASRDASGAPATPAGLSANRAAIPGAEDRAAAYTPGPWNVDPRPEDNGHGLRQYSVYEVESDEEIARVWGLKAEEGLANARLIAAGPDLYAALIQAMQLFGPHGPVSPVPTLQETGAWVDMTRETLDRVAGRETLGEFAERACAALERADGSNR